MKLIGTPHAQISTPDGLITLNRNGHATLVLKSTVDFIRERIESGGLAGYELTDDEVTSDPKPDSEPEGKGKNEVLSDEVGDGASKTKPDSEPEGKGENEVLSDEAGDGASKTKPKPKSEVKK